MTARRLWELLEVAVIPDYQQLQKRILRIVCRNGRNAFW